VQIEHVTVYWWENPEGKRPLGRSIYRWVDDIERDLKRDWMGWYGLD
jgi:hypothetical protein